MKTVMVGPGAYTVCEGRLSVQIIRNYELQGPDKWIAYASWNPWPTAHRFVGPGSVQR